MMLGKTQNVLMLQQVIYIYIYIHTHIYTVINRLYNG